MEGHGNMNFNNNYHQAHAALVNLALNNSLAPARLSHASPLITDYSRAQSLYGMSPGLVPAQQGSPLMTHSHQSPALGGYTSPLQAQGNEYGLQSPVGSQQNLSSYGAYTNGIQGFAGNGVNLSSPVDHYQHRNGFQY